MTCIFYSVLIHSYRFIPRSKSRSRDGVALHSIRICIIIILKIKPYNYVNCVFGMATYHNVIHRSKRIHRVYRLHIDSTIHHVMIRPLLF